MESKEIARKRILALIKENGGIDSHYEKLFGLRNHTIAEWRQGTLATYMNILPKIAEEFNVSTDYLLGYDKLSPEIVSVPIIGSIRAGYPVESYENIYDYVSLPTSTGVKNPENLFALRVVGDSMMPVVMEGDIIICDKNADQANGKICAVTIDGESTLKRIRIDSQGITLIPTNPMYKELHYTPKKAEEKGFRVDGVLVQMIRNF